MMYLPAELLEYAIAIEAIAVIAYGVIRGGIEVRRFIAVGAALVLAYFLPALFGIASPGSPTYLVLYREVEVAEEGWGLMFMATAKAGLAWAIGMFILNIIASISSLGIGVLPLQEFEVLQNMGFIIDPIMDVVFAVMHVSQVMIAVLHTIAYLAWFSYAVAPVVIGIAVLLMVFDRTRAAGVALFILTLAIMFIATIAAHDALAFTKAKVMNETNALMQWLQNNAPRTKVRAFLILNSTYPYLVSGTLYGINYTVVGKAMVLIEYPVTNFTAFTDSETPVNALGIPSISNVTFLWLSINPGHGCLLLTYIDNKSATEPCDSPQYLNSNATYAEVIYFGNPPFSVITATINNTVVYTGAWKWLSPPTQSTVETSNNTVTINFTISIPPEHCINITNPRTGLNETICYPGTTSALLWYFASNAQVQLPSKVGNSTTCQYTVLNTTLYREVNIGSEEDELKALINKLNEEITIGRNITGVGKNLTLKLPSPAPTGYEQKEIEITCTNYANKTVVVPGSITITGNIGNPWYAKVPLGLTPSISWVINSIVVGSQELLSGWSYFRKLFFAVGGFVPRWLAESVMIFGLLDGAMWIAGFPTPMAPAWAVMNNVIYDLSLVLYLRIGGMGRILNRITRRVRKAVGSRTRAIQERVGHWVSRHRRVARLVNPITKAFHDTKAFVGREIVPRLTPLRILTSPLSTGLRVAKELAEDKALTYEQEGRVWRTRLARAGAVLAKAAVEYPRARELGMRGRLYEVTGMKLLSEEGKKELLSALRSRDFRRAYRALRMTTEMDRRFLYEELSTKTLDRDMHVYEARRGDIKRVNKGELLTDLMNAIIMAPLASVGTLHPALITSRRVGLDLAEELTVRLRHGGMNAVDTAKLVAAALAPYIIQSHEKAEESMRSVREAARAVQALFRGDWSATLDLARAMDIEHEKVKEILNNALSTHLRQALPRYMRDPAVKEQARADLRTITDVLHTMRNSVVLSYDALKPLMDYFRDNYRAITTINDWWARHIDRLNKAINQGASNDELMLINKLSIKELTSELSPFVNARYREALEQRALQAASRDPEVIRQTAIDTLRSLNYGEWVRERAGDYREYQRLIAELGTFIREGSTALGRESFNKVFPRLAEIAIKDGIADKAMALHLAITEDHHFAEVAVGKAEPGKLPQPATNTHTAKAVIDRALTMRMTPGAALLSMLQEVLGDKFSDAIAEHLKDLNEKFVKGELTREELEELRQLARDLRQLYTHEKLDIDKIEEKAPELAAKIINANDTAAFREFFREVRKAVYESEGSRLAKPGELISPWSMDDDKAIQLITKYMPKMEVDLLKHVVDTLDFSINNHIEEALHTLDTAYGDARQRLDELQNELARAWQAGDYKRVQDLNREIERLRAVLEPVDRLIDMANKVLAALASIGNTKNININALPQLLRVAEELEKLVGSTTLKMPFGNTAIDLDTTMREPLLRAAEELRALALTAKAVATADWAHNTQSAIQQMQQQLQGRAQPNQPTQGQQP